MANQLFDADDALCLRVIRHLYANLRSLGHGLALKTREWKYGQKIVGTENTGAE